jgi:PhnB protein
MITINPYLNFKGNTEEAFNFYKSVFGGEFLALMRFGDTPGCENMPEADKEKIMHVALPLGKNNILMATDVLEGTGADCVGNDFKVGNNISLSLSPESEEEADKLFAALSEGGQVVMPMEKASWGDYFGMLTDKYGIQWMVNYAIEGASALANQEKEQAAQP